jgi:hypothetical protein
MKKIIFILLLFFLSLCAYSATWQEAFNQCEAARAGNTGYKCATYTGAQCNNTGYLGWVSRQLSTATSCLQNSVNQYGFTSYDCPSGQTRDVNGNCVSSCTAGNTGDFFKIFTFNQPTELTLNTLTVDQNTVNACYGGCSYTANIGGQLPQVGVSADGTKQYHKFSGQQTGASCTGGNVSPGDIATTTSFETPNNCVLSEHKIVCVSTEPDDAGQCGTVQAPGALLPTKVCVNGSDPTCTKVEGFADPICSGADKNCGWKNGQYTCAESDTGASKTGAPKDCIVNAEGKKACVTGQDGVKSETSKGTVANPDGSTTTTETTTNNVIGDGAKTKTTTTQPNGDSTTTTTGDGASNGNGTAESGEGGGDCRKYPESIGCSQYGTIPEPDTVTTQDAPGLGPGSSLDGAAWGVGSCPAPITMNLSLAGTKSFSLQPLCDFMTAVYPVVLAISWLIAGYIVVGAVRD